MDLTSDEAPYALTAFMSGHEGAVRALHCCANGAAGVPILMSGSMDRVLRQWRPVALAPDGGGGGFEENPDAPANYEHENWVVAIAELGAGVLADAPDGGFVTGCMDKKIRVFSRGGVLLRTLTGHEHGVISLGWCADGTTLISGSWDGTARLWRLDVAAADGTVACDAVLPGHANGVCVLGLPNGDIATGATGRQEGNGIVDCAVRIWRKAPADDGAAEEAARKAAMLFWTTLYTGLDVHTLDFGV